MSTTEITIRAANKDDLPALNRVIEAAVMTWDLPERVKRLSLPSYRYDELDLDHHSTVVAETEGNTVVGVAAWEAATARDCPPGKSGLLLHGLYVEPSCKGRGIGSALLQQALDAATQAGVDGLLVKAQADALGFFERQGMGLLPAEDEERQYANRLWRNAP